MSLKSSFLMAAAVTACLAAASVSAQVVDVSRTGPLQEQGAPGSTPALPLGMGTLVLDESFEGTFPPAGWLVRNQSAVIGTNVNCWNQFTGATPWAANTGTAHTGANFNCTSGNNTISGWLISSPISGIKNGDEVRFFTRQAAGNTFPDRLELRLCIDAAAGSCGAAGSTGTSATDVGEFSTLLLSVNPTLVTGVYPDAYTQFSATISGLPASGNGRVALRYFVTSGGPSGANSNLISVDDVSFVSAVLPGELSVSTTAISFGSVTLGASSQQTLTISNTGAGPLSITGISAPTAPFSTSGGTCGATPFDLAAGASCTVVYTFAPVTIGSFNASVIVSAGADSATVGLSGSSLAPPPAFIPVDSPWALALLAAMMSLVAGIAVVRRKA